MANKKQVRLPELNFVPRDPFYETPLGKASVWALRIGRYVVIFTEIIVIMSFASRFKLDRDLTDINASVVQKTAVVKSYADTEKQVRLIQKKSEAVTQIIQQNDGLAAFNTFINKVPFDVKLSRVGYTPNEIQITGTARSSLSFSLFLQTLQQEPLFKEVSIDQLATGDKRDPGLAFAIRLKLRDQTAAPVTPNLPKAATPPSNTGSKLQQEANF